MTNSWFASVFFTIAFLGLLSSNLMLQKKSEKLNLVVWIPVNIILVICGNVFFSAIINLLHIPVNIVSVGFIDLIFAIALWWWILKKNKKQAYYYNVNQIIIFLIILCAALWYAFRHFGLELTVSFQAVDAPKHFRDCINIVKSNTIDTKMFFSDITGALFIENFSVFFEESLYYKIFVLSEIVNFALAGVCFFSLIAKYCTSKFMNILIAILSLFYLLGYPANNMLFGFVYWGLAVTILCVVLFILELWVQETSKWLYSIYLLFLLFGLFEAYALFVPPVFLGSFIYMAYNMHSQKMLFKRYTILNGLLVYVPATVIGMLYSYSMMSYAGIGVVSDSVSSALPIQNNGGLYKSLYSDFVVLLPFSLLIFWRRLKKKKLTVECSLFICMVLYMALLLYKGSKGEVSSYYYCKNNYVVWLLVFVSAISAIYYLWEEKHGQILIPYFITWGLIAVLFYTEAESDLESRNSQFAINTAWEWSYSVPANRYYGIYAWNRAFERTIGYSDEKMQLYAWVYDNLTSKGESVAICSEDNLDEEWYRAITKSNSGFAYSDWDRFLSVVEPEGQYICVMYDNFYYHHQSHFADYEKIYEGEAGFVVKK